KLQKQKIMRPISFSREILVVTTSSFAQRQLCERDSRDESSHLTPTEQLEAACWNGLMSELLPEIMNDPFRKEKVFLWQVEAGSSYLRLSMGTLNPDFISDFTIDPHILLHKKE